jgi:5S rRNA maturation endonuclease (ribonuclease M5)
LSHHPNGDRHPSARYNVQKETWHCDVGKIGGGRKDLRERLGMASDQHGTFGGLVEEAAYDYRDADGKLRYQVVRYRPKTFRQRRPDGQWGLVGCSPLLYRLPELLAGPDPVLVCEGEKDVDTAVKLGWTATCNSGGAGKWRDEFAEHLKGRTVVVIADADEPGRIHAAKVVESLAGKSRMAVSMELETAKDLTEWHEGGGTADGLSVLIQRTLDDAAKKVGGLDLPEAVEASIRELADIREHGYDLQWGIKGLDERLGGIRRKRVYAIGGWTSHGKTATALNVVRHNLKGGKRVLYFAMENPDEIPPRLAALEYDIPLTHFTRPQHLTPVEYAMAKEGLEKTSMMGPLRIVKPRTPSEMQYSMAGFRPDLVVVDYIQRWVLSRSMADSEADDKGYRLSVSKAASFCTDLAQEHGAALLMLSQLARPTRRLPGKNEEPDDWMKYDLPHLGMLKESGDLENFTDDALLCYWRCKDDRDYDVGRYFITIAKCKMGATGLVQCSIDPSTNRIE